MGTGLTQGGLHEGRGQASDSAVSTTASPSAISSILGTWLDQYSEDFCQPPDFPCLRQLAAYVQLNMPGSDLERRAHLLLAQLEQTELEGEEQGVAGTWGGARAGHTGAASRGWHGPGAKTGLRPPPGGPQVGKTSWAEAPLEGSGVIFVLDKQRCC